ncbi:carboxylesterase family protein [Hyalangium versicolor]|uniref:carboxylesterase family protein n=1 Tax=Hyalangium versicolor TaxID=2861190 RepID=UPI001CCED7F4|nr:hypothetical protein [Hyalangium versicolor]
MRRLVALLCLWGLVGCSGEFESESPLETDASQRGQAASVTAKIPITAAMVRLDPARPAQGNYSTAFDEQTLAGDPVLGTGGKPTTNWSEQSWNTADYPAGFYIDLGAQYVVTHVAYFDTFSTDAVNFDTGSPGQWTRQVTSQSTGWEQWRIFPLTSVTTRYIQYSRGMYAGVNEILIYGYLADGTPPPNQPPVASITPPGAITLPTATATLRGAGTDSDGTISSYQWTQVSGPNTATISGGTTATATVSGLVAGTYKFRLTVTDNGGASATAEATLLVNPAPNGPVPYGVQTAVKKSSTRFGTQPPFGYYEYLPSQYDADPTKKWPLIIMLHGLGERGNGESELSKLLGQGLTGQIQAGTFAAHDKFIVVSPQFIWYEPNFIRDVLNFVKAHYRVDESRMYLTGLSLGGIATWSYVNTYGSTVEFAAVSPIAGNALWGGISCAQFATVPMWVFHGEKDDNKETLASLDIAGVQTIRNCSVPPVETRLTLYPDEFHDSWTITYDLRGMQRPTNPNWDPYNVDLYSWFLQHTK